jgi:hypothetical protein
MVRSSYTGIPDSMLRHEYQVGHDKYDSQILADGIGSVLGGYKTQAGRDSRAFSIDTKTHCSTLSDQIREVRLAGQTPHGLMIDKYIFTPVCMAYIPHEVLVRQKPYHLNPQYSPMRTHRSTVIPSRISSQTCESHCEAQCYSRCPGDDEEESYCDG